MLSAFLDALTYTLTLAAAFATCILAYLALKGFNTWKEQLKAKNEYELARRIFINTHKYKDAISEVRFPLMKLPTEPAPIGHPLKEDPEFIHFYWEHKLYEKRWNKVSSIYAELGPDLIEAKAVWGNKLQKLFNKLFDIETELEINFNLFMDYKNPDTNKAYQMELKSQLKRIEAIVHEDLIKVGGDHYKKDLLSAIEEIEKYLTPKIHYASNDKKTSFLRNKTTAVTVGICILFVLVFATKWRTCYQEINDHKEAIAVLSQEHTRSLHHIEHLREG